MKVLIVSLSFMLAAGATPALANDANSNDPRVQAAFANRFSGAENVKWTRLEDGYEKVAFTMAGTRAEAYYNADGEFLGTVRNLFYNQLPLSVIQSISNRFQNGVILEIREITNIEGTSYKVVLEQKDKKYKVRLNSLGEITEQQKEKIKK